MSSQRRPKKAAAQANGASPGQMPRQDSNGLLGRRGKEEAESLFTDGHDDEKVDTSRRAKGGLSQRDKFAMALLIVLYFIQGLPIGLAFGSIPVLLKNRLSYSQIAVFGLCTYPYSLKLLWSPIVDSAFSHRIGRRKSWIVPMQAIIGSLMIYIGRKADDLIENAETNIWQVTGFFFALVFFAATQDIAVDGWALTLLSQANLSYASTAQTVGLTSGTFLSYTVFLALNSVDFANAHLRSIPSDAPFLSLGTYLQFWGFFCFAVTLWLFFFKKEDPVAVENDTDLSLGKVYEIMWKICQLKHVQALCLIHFVAKIGFQANEAASELKFLEKGLKREDLALIVLLDFPLQIIGGWLAAKWSIGDQPLRPWLHGYWIRLGFCVFAMALVRWFPTKLPIGYGFFLLIAANKVFGGFAGTIQFVGISAFHTQISDPVIGGTYMTLLNTVSNLGGTWPRFFVLRGVDYFSIANCHVKVDNADLILETQECLSDHGKSACAELGGRCITERDGYYTISTICVLLGAILLVGFIWPAARKLQRVPAAKWRVYGKSKK